jgi:hypothetical protein
MNYELSPSFASGNGRGFPLLCLCETNIDISSVTSPQPTRKRPSSGVPKIAFVLMIIIVVTLALVAVFSNIQRLRRDRIETTVVIPAGSPTPQPR